MAMTDSKIRWGILGVAKINERLLPGFTKARYAELKAIASRSLERARSAAASAGIPNAYGSYEALLDDPSIDAVYVPLPNTLHAEWVMRAAERHKHVLCEKPLSIDAVQAKQVVDFCHERGVNLMEGFMWPHHPRTLRLHEFLRKGGIGEIRRVTGAFTFHLEEFYPQNIRLQPKLGGGSLLDVGCYPIYGVRWAFGAEPISAFATAQYLHDVDVEMSGLVWLADGRVGAFDCGFKSPFRGHLEITGSEGVVWVQDMWLPPRRAAFEIRRTGLRVEEVVVEGQDQIVCMIENFSRAILEGRPSQPDADEAVATLKVLDALGRSAREGKVVPI